MAELPIAPFERLLKKAGAGRVSEEAAERLRDTIEEQTWVAVDPEGKPSVLGRGTTLRSW